VAVGAAEQAGPLLPGAVPPGTSWAITKASSAPTHIRSALKPSATERSRGAAVEATGLNPVGPSASTPPLKAGSGERRTNWPEPSEPVARPLVSVNIR